MVSYKASGNMAPGGEKKKEKETAEGATLLVLQPYTSCCAQSRAQPQAAGISR